MDKTIKAKKPYEPPEVKDIKPVTVVDVIAKGVIGDSEFTAEE